MTRMATFWLGFGTALTVSITVAAVGTHGFRHR